jgi:hypothetical protein
MERERSNLIAQAIASQIKVMRFYRASDSKLRLPWTTVKHQQEINGTALGCYRHGMILMLHLSYTIGGGYLVNGSLRPAYGNLAWQRGYYLHSIGGTSQAKNKMSLFS